MRRTRLRAIGLGVALVALGFGACRLLLPERLAVNVPMGRGSPPSSDVFGGRIQVPPGFSIRLWAELPRVRFLRPVPGGDLLASVPREGRVVRLLADRDGDGRSDGSETLLADLDRPHGLDLHGGWLYVAETGAVRRIRFDPADPAAGVSGALETVVSGLPAGGNHWTRTARIGPDGGLYVSVGSSCNVCEEEDPRRAAMLRFDPESGRGGLYARGLRNAVGFDWRPGTGELYATDNGRDLLGDDFPPCELNRVVEGGDYGWPVANGDRIPDPDLGAGQKARIAASLPPVHGFRAHNAPLGITFLRSDAQPAGYRGAALVALHGSWNRTRKDGYKVVSLHWGESGRIEERDFVWGFLEGENVIGRPVDVAELGDGSIFVSDDYAGAVYRITRGAGEAVSRTAPAAGGARSDPLAALAEGERRAAAARGSALWERHACAGCHDPRDHDPGVVPVELRDLGARYDLEGLASYLAAPTPPMPAFDLTPGERRDLAVSLLADGVRADR